MLKASKIYTCSHPKRLTKPLFAKNKPAFDALTPGVCGKLLAKHVSLHQVVHLSDQARPHLPPAQVGKVQRLHVSFQLCCQWFFFTNTESLRTPCDPQTYA